MSKKKPNQKKGKNVFYSFDAPEDKILKDFAVGQNKNSSKPYTAQDKSLLKAQPQNKWEKAAERKIANSDQVIVMLGKSTHKADGVKKEIAMARKHGVPVAQVKPKNSPAKRVTGAGRLYTWTDENMSKLLGKKK